MVRTLSEERRNSILAATTALVAERGLGTSTLDIGKRAGISNGSLFTYFETKTALYNALYYELKLELTTSVLRAMAEGSDQRSRLHQAWLAWTGWGAENPAKRKTLAQLGVSDQISAGTRRATYQDARPIIELINEVSAAGALGNVPAGYLGALVDEMAGTTMDYMIALPVDANAIAEAGFEALWRMLN